MSVLTEVLKLFKYDPATDGDMTFNIGQCMNDNWDKLDAAILLAIAAAGAYNPEESYAVGDYCTYKGKLRKCSTAIPTGETWTEAHWTTTTVAAELAELSSQLSNKMGYVANATGFADLSDMPDESCICLTAVSGVTGLPDGWPVGRSTFVRFRPGNTQYALDFLQGYNNNKLAYRSGLQNWIEIHTATPPQVRSLTLQSGFTTSGGCQFFVMQESVVVLIGGVVNNNMTSNTLTQIGTLPADACPSHMIRSVAVTDNGVGYVEVHADGTVWLNVRSMMAECRFIVAFVAGGDS